MKTVVLILAAVAASSATNTYSPNDANLYYSPFAWQVNANSASTINSAAYVKFMFSGSQLNFRFNVSRMATPASEVYWRVDNGPSTLSLVMESVSVAIPPNNTAGTVPFHTVELFVKSTTERANRWLATGTSTRVILTGIECDGTLAPWIPSDVNLLIYGDSITEGVLTLGGSQRYDTDHNDASVVYSYQLGHLLGAEVGVIGFGASGLTHDGSGGVVPLGQSWNQLWDGVPRSFVDPKPDLILLNEGTNDGCDVTTPGCVGTDITASMATVLKGLVGACPGVPIGVLLPFNGGQAAHLQAAVKEAGATGQIHYIDTTGFYNLSYGGSLHPTGPNDVAQIAPQIAKKVRPILARRLLEREREETAA